MTHDFTGKAILCSTWQQMLHLADIAREQGMAAHPDQFDEHNFAAGARYFALFTNKTYCMSGDVEPNEVEIPYTTFINPPTDESVYGC